MGKGLANCLGVDEPITVELNGWYVAGLGVRVLETFQNELSRSLILEQCPELVPGVRTSATGVCTREGSVTISISSVKGLKLGSVKFSASCLRSMSPCKQTLQKQLILQQNCKLIHTNYKTMCIQLLF